MKRIDNPSDVALTQYEGEPEDTTQEIILKIAGAIFPPVGLATALRDHFSAQTRYERILRVFVALKSDIESIQKESTQNKKRADAIEDRLRSPEFTEAILTAAEEAARTAESRKLDRLASILANGVDPDVLQPEDDLASFVRDVSQLSELDIKTMNVIFSTSQLQGFIGGSVFSTEASDSSGAEKPFDYLGKALLESAALEKIKDDDFYSTAYRLVGFGLALEAPSHTGRRQANNLSFLPTKRGRKLIALLKKPH